jgi:hypothetical protein
MQNRWSRWAVTLLVGMGCSILSVACGEESGGETTITAIDPGFGHLQGDQAVRILGDNFRTDIGYTVYFAHQRSTKVTIMNPQTLMVTTPQAEQPGKVDITIRADNGPAFRLPQAFEYREVQAPGKGQGNLQF